MAVYVSVPVVSLMQWVIVRVMMQWVMMQWVIGSGL